MLDPLADLPVPPRPQQSRVIFQGNRYVASAMRDGSLIVQDSSRGTGRRLVGAQVPEWADAIERAMDGTEAHFLCREFLKAS